MRIVDKWDDNIDLKQYFTIELFKDNNQEVFCDVAVVYNEKEEIDYLYVMQCEDGGTVYTLSSKEKSIGNLCDYNITENEIILFVLNLDSLV